MRTILLALALAPMLAFVAVSPVAGAVVTPTCQVVVHTWYEPVHCGTTSTAVNSYENWCPSTCVGFTIISCTGTLLFPCTIL